MDLFEIFQVHSFDPNAIAGLVIRFIFNIGMAATLILLVYTKNSRNKEFAFTLFSFNMIIFALCTILNNVELSIGAGFGLFAVFTMMRYRSEQIAIKDLTYLLIMVGLGFINSTFRGSIGPIEILFLNVSLIVFLYILEKSLFSQKFVKQKIKYDRLDLLNVSKQRSLQQDLEDRIGAQIVDIHIESVNYLDGCANIIVKYNKDKPGFTHPYFITKKPKLPEEKEEPMAVNAL